MKGRAGRKQRWKKGILALAVFFLSGFLFFQPLAHASGENDGRNCEKKDIRGITAQGRLSGKDYRLIQEQTGLSRPAVDAIRKHDHFQEELVAFQEAYLCERKIECCRTSLFTKQDRIRDIQNESVPLAPLEDGDVIVSFSSHSLGWHHGHAGLIVDANRQRTLEAVMPGEVSKIKDMGHWWTYSDFQILRLKGVSKERRKEIAAYAEENLQGIPYGLMSGILENGEEEQMRSAQCAYLIWRAFFHFGYDLDSDGGQLVTVKDLAESGYLEQIQVFGVPPKSEKDPKIKLSEQVENSDDERVWKKMWKKLIEND